MAKDIVVDAGRLQRATEAIVAKGGSEPREAALVAENLVTANLTGHDSHGVGMIPRYVDAVLEGGLAVNEHPEIELARWAAAHLTPEQRAGATVYTSGEHCPMCAAAHGWVGLGRIVYASSSAQLVEWLAEVGASAPPVMPLPVRSVAPGVVVEGPVDDLADEVRALQLRAHQR